MGSSGSVDAELQATARPWVLLAQERTLQLASCDAGKGLPLHVPLCLSCSHDVGVGADSLPCRVSHPNCRCARLCWPSRAAAPLTCRLT